MSVLARLRKYTGSEKLAKIGISSQPFYDLQAKIGANLMQAEYCGIWLVQDEQVVVLGSYNLPADQMLSPLGHAAIESDITLHICSPELYPDHPMINGQKADVRTVITVPLSYDGVLTGLMAIATRAEFETLKKTDLKILTQWQKIVIDQLEDQAAVKAMLSELYHVYDN